MASRTKTRRKRQKFSLWKVFVGDGKHGDISLSFFAYVMILLVVGIVMMSSASYAWAYSEHGGDGLFYAKSQAKNAIIGFAAMIFFMKMDYHNFKSVRLPLLKKFNIAGFLYVVGIILLILVLAIGNDEGGSMGAKRWLTLGPINFQPSEVAKLAIIIYFAYSMERDGKQMNKFKIGIIKYGLRMAIYVGLLYKEPHMSGLILVGSISVVMILCGGANIRQFLLLGAGSVVAAVAVIAYQSKIPGSYIATRIKSWHDPFADVLDETWQTANSIIAIGSGGLFGLGLGNSRQKYLYLPETKNDFVFPIVCEELGFVGAIAIIIVFFLLVVEGFSIAVRCKDRFGMLIAVGITTQIGIQTVLNLAVVSNLIPNTGISLPFFSYGGTALIMQLAEMGIMLNISQHRYYPSEKGDFRSRKKADYSDGKRSKSMKVLIACGGTGGHINPGLAIADIIKSKYPDTEFLFAGTPKGMEAKLVPKAGYKLETIKVAGFQRKISLENIGRNIKAVAYLATSGKRARQIINGFKPDIAIGTGGYAAGPVIRMAAKNGHTHSYP